MPSRDDFFNLYRHGFARVAVATPRVRIGDPRHNADATLELMQQAARDKALLAVFPELGLSAYTCDDLFHQRTLIDAAENALAQLLARTRNLPLAALVGLPVAVDGRLYNCAALLCRGRLVGVVPKTYLPNYREFYEARQFTPGDSSPRSAIALAGQDAAFGTNLLFRLAEMPAFVLHVEICEDLWVPAPPSSFAALAGASVIGNLSASNIIVGKEGYRHQLVANQSARCLAAYLYSAAGIGESTTDLAWDGHAIIYENGTLLAESQRFAAAPQLALADVDLDRLLADRMRQNTFAEGARRHPAEVARFRSVEFSLPLPRGRLPLERRIGRFPYVPGDAASRDLRCEEVYRIQVQGLVTRMQATGTRKLVIGVSGGLDSTQALLVCARALDELKLPRRNILAYTMPGFATTSRTRNQAWQLMRAVGASAEEIDIRPSCMQMLKDIGHPYARGRKVYDVSFENVQAGERTSHLFRLANLHGGFVVGTGDLSELALGWCTYGVGDQMSHYNVNASVPKTLIQYLVGWVAESDEFSADVKRALKRVLDTEISPELVPGKQSTEAIIGPYELQDFNLYYTLRFGYAPAKVAFLAWNAWKGEYRLREIRKWLGVFLKRFFQMSQYKRSAMPNAPKVGSGGSLSPRGDWRAPADGNASAWLADLARVPTQD
ncbi:MAG: NAD(+) synthase [Betaproteobacteria bacterium]|nr:MAG: NAD(+) synthase [Betaproteobacteria bacterium]TMI12317.1 MAG: NAD(+) synthase [Betaproteobacteria bacterium]